MAESHHSAASSAWRSQVPGYANSAQRSALSLGSEGLNSTIRRMKPSIQAGGTTVGTSGISLTAGRPLGPKPRVDERVASLFFDVSMMSLSG